MVPTRLPFLYTGRVMFLLYLDASGTVLDPNGKYIIVAGVAIFERQIYHAVKGLDDLAAKINPHHPEEVEFHGSVMFQARQDWKRIGLGESRDLIASALGVLKNTHRSTRLFAAAIHKSAISPRDPIEYAFEQVCNRFDRYLHRLYRVDQNRQRGLIIFDESRYEGALQRLSVDFRTIGHSWGILHDLVEVPLFVNSKASRLVQFADLVSFATYRYYEQEDPRYFNLLTSRFDHDGGVIHGLVHYTPEGDYSCECPVCAQRKGK